MEAEGLKDRAKPEPYRFQLRRATRREHDSLDGHPVFAAMVGGALCLEGYRRLMVVLHGFYRRHDPLFSAACAAHGLDRFGYAYAPRAGIIGRDLAELGVAAHDGVEPAPLPPFRSPAALAGALYVVEGSMLGGAMLSRPVEAVVADAGGDGYWRWCRDAGAGRWATTCAMIEALSTHEPDRTDMIAGARRAFAAFEGWFGLWTGDDAAWAAGRGRSARC